MEAPSWKVAEVVEALASEDFTTLITREMERLAGRLEMRGLQRVRVNMEIQDDLLHFQAQGVCPCGNETLQVREKFPLDAFASGPHTVLIRLGMIEAAMLNRHEAPAVTS